GSDDVFGRQWYHRKPVGGRRRTRRLLVWIRGRDGARAAGAGGGRSYPPAGTHGGQRGRCPSLIGEHRRERHVLATEVYAVGRLRPLDDEIAEWIGCLTGRWCLLLRL